jgi:predicted MPP superfamily phosphohydrolase
VAYSGGALLGCLGLLSAYRLRLTQVTIPLARLPGYWAGRTIALVSDLHLGNLRGAAFSRRLVTRLGQLGAECILVGGDMFDGVKTDVEQAVRPWSDLRAPSGVFFVGGNHDDYGGRRGYFAALRQVGMRELENGKVDLHGIQLVGVHDEETHRPDTFKAILDLAHLDATRPSILLAHRPENLAVPERAGIDLQLSGHTHGGQFWPWTHLARRVHGRFAQGLSRFGRMLVYTSTGAGTWGPPFRLGTRAEIVLIRLEPA